MFTQNQEDWDDSIIMNVFNTALKQHRTRVKEDTLSALKVDVEAASSSIATAAAPDAAKLNTLSNSKSTANNSVGELVTGEKRKREEDRLATSTGPSLQQALKTFKQSKSQEKNENNKGKSPNKSLNPSDQPESSSKLNKKVAFVDNSTATSSAATLPVGDYNTNTTSQQSQEAADYYNYYYNYSMPSFPTPTPTSMATSSTPTTISSTMIDEALQNMLTAWYQSGYATARYQTLCELGGYGLAYATEDSTKQPSVEKDQTGTNP